MKSSIVASTIVVCACSCAHAVAPSPVGKFLELRIYKTHEAQRDRFLGYFETHFVDSQEAAGMRIWGQYRDLNTPDHFVWMRGYETMHERPAKLMDFYTSPLWQERGPAVREMLVSSRHVRLLEPVEPQAGLHEADRPRIAEEDPAKRGVVVVEVFMFEDVRTLEMVRSEIVPRIEDRGGVLLGIYRSTEHAENFPALPFITDENVIAWIGSFQSAAAYVDARADIAAAARPFEVFVLEPGAKSRLFHRPGEPNEDEELPVIPHP